MKPAVGVYPIPRSKGDDKTVPSSNNRTKGGRLFRKTKSGLRLGRSFFRYLSAENWVDTPLRLSRRWSIVLRGEFTVMKSISILLVDDHNVVRQGLRALLSAEPDIDIVGEAATGWQALRLAKELHPEIVIMDLAMPGLNGLEATRQILSVLPQTKILVLTSYDNDEYVTQMVEAGVAGYLNKQTAAHDLVRAIREVHKGNAFFSPSVARRLRDRSRANEGRGRLAVKSNELTARELQVLRLIAQGFANKQMAAELGISVKTIEKHRQHVMKKLGIHEIAGLTRYAAEKGMIQLEPGPDPRPREELSGHQV